MRDDGAAATVEKEVERLVVAVVAVFAVSALGSGCW